ncbi:energy transducer TonB [Arenicella xantha]|uniref:Protein TonB n=1 Tax=Arenicella xantha TaxID=644221 RepID=A0A395JK14_9GAMM|nr:energy transducer TonB [Arenicella xantha]RBP51116.1 TonB family protein [Arenicella xantha]
MNQQNSRRVILFSRDDALIEDINLKTIGDQGVASNNLEVKVESALNADLVSNELTAVIYDLDLVGNDLNIAAIDILQLRQACPDLSLILIGEKEPLSKALKTERIASMVTKSVSKPKATNQLLMAISAAGILNDGQAKIQRQSNIKRYSIVAGGVCAIGLVSALLLSGRQAVETPVTAGSDSATQRSPNQASVPALSTNNQTQTEIRQLKVLASEAYSAGRLIRPTRDNAFYYYQKILELDDYDEQAYTMKWQILEQLRASFPSLIEQGEFDRAETIVAMLVEAEPFNNSNNDLQAKLIEATTDSDLLTQTATEDEAPEIEAKPAETQKQAEPARTKQQAAAAKADIEKRAANEISAAIKSGRLTPPQSNNAYQLLLSAAREKTVRQTIFTSLKTDLETRLVARAQQSLRDSNTGNAASDISFLRKLDHTNSALSELTASLVEARRPAAPAPVVEQPTPETAAAKTEPAKGTQLSNVAKSANNPTSVAAITPSEILNKAQPDYPRRAFNMDIEGWVELDYQVDETGQPINIKVVNAQPKKIFDKAGIDAIKRSRFSPARNTATGEAVTSDGTAIRFNFSIGR